MISTGGRVAEACSADSVVNNPYTLPIGQANQDGKIITRNSCAAIIATAYSAGKLDREGVVNTQTYKNCKRDLAGPRAATSIAAGIIALVLSAKPSLTLRDIMHLIAMGSEVAPLADNGDTWHRNGAGFWFSNDFGFGLLNAENMVNLAETFTALPKQHICTVETIFEVGASFTKNFIKIPIKTDDCIGKSNEVNFLEQIDVLVVIGYHTSVISVELVSPAGTTTELMEQNHKRPKLLEFDWTFKSYQNWGESPRGTWGILVKAQGDGKLQRVTLTLRGTADKPSHYSRVRPFRSYSAFRLENKKTSEDPINQKHII